MNKKINRFLVGVIMVCALSIVSIGVFIKK